MSKPSIVLAQWDTNQVHMTSVPAGNRQNGYAASEIPASDIENQYKYNLYLWLSWLDSAWDVTPGSTNALILDPDMHVLLSGTGLYKRGALVRKLAVSSAKVTGGTLNNTWTATANGQISYHPIALQEGEEITTIKAHVSCGATDVMRLSMWRLDTATQVVQQLGGYQSSTGHAGTTEILTISGLTETASSANHYVYYAIVDVTAFATGPTLWGIEYTTGVP